MYAILEEPESGHLWVSTNRGLGQIKRAATPGSFSIVAFQAEQKLPCEAFNIGAAYRSPSGSLYFGCDQGVTYFRREDVRELRTPPPVVITDFQLFFEPVPIDPSGNSPLQQSITETRRIRLSPSQNVLYFEFAALSYAQPERHQYAYRMEPFNAEWVYSRDKRSATYTNLDPGTYTFRVKAADHRGVWNEAGTSLQIIIPPPWYRRPVFYFLAILLLAAGIWAYIRRRTHQLEQNRRLLQEMVETRTREVSQQKERLEKTLNELQAAQSQLIEAEKMASLGQLTAGVAHEINNPITFVSGNVNPLKRDIADLIRLLHAYEARLEQLESDTPELQHLKTEVDYPFILEEINHLIRGIEEGADRTARIVRGLRNFSRLDEDELKPSDITQGLESTLLILSNRLKNRIEVEKEYADLPEILCYPGKLNQVFMNILTNAIQAVEALPEGAIRRLSVRTWREGDWVYIRISDNGAGMSEAVRRKVFDPFFTTKEVGVGTGLGLSISFGIMELHGGRIQVESIPGAGASFTIHLPYRLPSQT
ncbi:MAG: GHKL domain-containing protein [Bacteroidetes bacterium]|nr:MAG: GHKL domain-containing protein [Bacteroidota bacterium]